MSTTKQGRVIADPGGVYPPGVDVRQSATLSDDGLYRYALTRRWAPGGVPAQFVMLNPSTADADVDDPTIRRCVQFARALECAGIVVVNLYAYRATKPADLWLAEDPVGPDTDRILSTVARRSYGSGAPLVAAWGANAKPDRVAQVLELVEAAGAQPTSLGVTKAGAPRHPLYVKGDTALTPWPAP